MSKIIIHSQDYLQLINEEDIVFCKSDNNYTYVHLRDGNEVLICKSLSKFSKELAQNSFIRISQSYLINKDFIKKIDKRTRQIQLLEENPIKFTISIKDLLMQVTENINVAPPPNNAVIAEPINF